MKDNIIHILGVLALMLSSLVVKGQTYPVQTMINVIPPSSPYISDYTSSSPSRLQVSINLLDENQDELDVLISISIEGNGILLETDRNKVNQPYRLSSGPNILSGSDLTEYLRPENLLVSGMDRSNLINGDPLPEGMYNICIEIRDYLRQDKLITPRSCNMLSVQLNNPPSIIQPKCGEHVTFTQQQNVNFQWHINHDPSIKAEYKVKLVHVPEGMDANHAILSTSNPLVDGYSTTMTSFHYDVTYPELDYGEQYAFRVDVEDMMGNTNFENDGIGEVCSFFYGSDSLGHIHTLSPEMDKVLDSEALPPFSWDGIDNAKKGDQVHYQLSIVQLGNGQSPEEAIQNDLPVHVQKSENTSQLGKWNMVVDATLEQETQYVWIVEAFKGTQKVAQSNIGTFRTSSFISNFKAGNKTVEVLKLDNKDLTSLSGQGRIQIEKNGEWATIDFENLHIQQFGRNNILKSGKIDSELDKMYKVDLPTAREGEISFNASHILLDSEDFKLRGHVEWNYPHGTMSKNGPKILYTETDEVLFNANGPEGTLNFKQDAVQLVDPMGFEVRYDSSSTIHLDLEKPELSLSGVVRLPDSQKSHQNERVEIPFRNANSSFYFNGYSGGNPMSVQVHNQLNVYLNLREVIIDFDPDKSPPSLGNQANWMGAYFEKSDIVLNEIHDSTHQLGFDESSTIPIELQEGKKAKSWVGDDGLDLYYKDDVEMSNSLKFNSFSGSLNHFFIDVENNKIQEGQFNGQITIPLFADKVFKFTIPFHLDGLTVGHLDESIQGTQQSFGIEGAENYMTLNVRQGVFKGNDHLDLNVNLDWSNLQISNSSGEKGINVSELKVYGDGDITLNGSHKKIGLDERYEGIASGKYELHADSVGVEKKMNAYHFSLVFDIPMGNNISGDDGVPFADITSGDGDTEEMEELTEPNTVEGGFSIPKLSLNFGGMLLKLEKLELREDEEWGRCFEAEGKVDKTGMFPTGKTFTFNFHVIVGKKEKFFYSFVDLYLGRLDTEAIEHDDQLRQYYDESMVEHGTNPFDEKGFFDGVPLKGLGVKMFINMKRKKEAEEFEVMPEEGAFGGGGAFTFRIAQGENDKFVDITAGADFVIEHELVRQFSAFIKGTVYEPEVADGEIEGSFFIDFDEEVWNAEVEADIYNPFCMKGKASLENEWGEEEWHVKIGEKEEPVTVFPYPESHCTGVAGLFFFDYDPGEIEAGFGLMVEFFAKSPWVGLGDIVSVKGTVRAYLAGMIYGSYYWNEKSKGLGSFGLDLTAGVKVSLVYKVASDKPSGAADVINLTLHADGHVEFPEDENEKSCHFNVSADGEGTIVGFDVKFKWHDEWESESPFKST